MIEYPDDRDVLAQAQALDVPAPVLIRDIVRIVEVLNLREKNFFGPRSVLSPLRRGSRRGSGRT